MWYMHYLCRLTKEVYLPWCSAPAGWSSCTPRDSRVAGSVRLARLYRPCWSVVEWFEFVLAAGYIGEFGGAARRPFVLRRGSSSSLACGYNLVGHQGGHVTCQLKQSFQSYNRLCWLGFLSKFICAIPTLEGKDKKRLIWTHRIYSLFIQGF